MFNLVVPLACAYICLKILENPSCTVTWFGAVGIINGLLSLAYGAFAVCVGVGVLALLTSCRGTEWRCSLPKVTTRIVALTTGFAIPLFIWIGICVSVAGGYYNAEVAMLRQFLWLLDAARLGVRGIFVSLSTTLSKLEFW